MNRYASTSGPEPDDHERLTASPSQEFVGSAVRETRLPINSKRAANPFANVDFPQPSIPSTVMNRPRTFRVWGRLEIYLADRNSNNPPAQLSLVLAKGSGPFVGGALVAAAILAALAYALPSPLTVTLLLMSLIPAAFTPYFFRDPDRGIGPGVVSPADGRVMAVEEAGGAIHIAVFMNVHDVHVNRAPVDCVVKSMTRSGEGYKMAFEGGSSSNVRAEWVFGTKYGDVRMHQITGWFARRIVPYTLGGERLKKGERLGMIRFGSRVDVWLPIEIFEPTVKVGARVLAGASTIATERRGGGL
jgi:phosphatidylserine decarboxylase